MSGIFVILAAYLAVVATLAVFQRRLIFMPDKHRPGPPPAALPDATSLDITTSDGLALTCWFMRPAQTGGATVLFLHGNAGHLGYRAARLCTFAHVGWGALLLGYRGYGGNAGSPSEQGVLTDARAAVLALRVMGIPAERVLIWGESLGTGVAVQIAATTEVAGLVLEAPFTSLADVARARFPWAPVRLLLRDRFDSLSQIANVRCPLFVLAGERDTLVPAAMSRRLFAAANEPKLFRLQKTAGHNDLGTPDVVEAVATFLRSLA